MGRPADPVRTLCPRLPLPLPLVCLALLLLAPTPAPALDLTSILTSVLENATKNLYKTEEITLFDHYCTLTRRPSVRKFKLYYKTKVYCPSWTSLIGKSDDQKSPTGSEREATKNFVQLALDEGLITQEQAQLYL